MKNIKDTNYSPQPVRSNLAGKRKEYTQKYYKLYDDGVVITEIDDDMRATGEMLIKHAHGIVLDCGCGTVPQIWSIFMPKAKEIHAIDLPIESIEFVKDKIKNVHEWSKRFSLYQDFVGKSLPEDYILQQVSKIKTVTQADMTKPLPFNNEFFDTVLSMYSMGTLASEHDLDIALQNIRNVLKTGGIFIHVNTNGQNSNEIIPEYTWNGLVQTSELIERYLIKNNFNIIHKNKMRVTGSEMYKYNEIHILCAVKK